MSGIHLHDPNSAEKAPKRAEKMSENSVIKSIGTARTGDRPFVKTGGIQINLLTPPDKL